MCRSESFAACAEMRAHDRTVLRFLLPSRVSQGCRFSGPTRTLQALARVLSVLVAQQRARRPPPLQPQKLLFLIGSGAGRPARSFVAPASLPVLFCGPNPSVPLILRESTASLKAVDFLRMAG